MATLKELREAANKWAAQEKADIESGAKKAPLTSTERVMAENKKNPFPIKTEHYAKQPAMKQHIYSEAAASRIDTTVGTASSSRPGKDLGEKYPGTTGQTIENARNIAKGYRAGRAIAEGRIGDPSEYTDLAVPRSWRPGAPAAAESRTKANKPLKTALVREVEPGRNRGRLAAQTREARKNYPGEQLQSNQDAKLDRLQSAAETGEAQSFVGQMKPGVAARTAAHTLQSREFNYPPQNQSKDLGRAVTNVIRSEQGRPDGGSLRALAKKRAKEGRSVAGPDAPSVPKNRRGTYKGKPAGGRGGVSGSAPDVTIDMNMGDLTKAPGWKKRLEPGDL